MYITTEANWNLRSLLRIVLLRQLFIYDFTTGSALWFLASQMIHKRSIEERWTNHTVCRAREIERCKTPQVVYWFLGFSKWLNWTAHNEPQHHGWKKTTAWLECAFKREIADLSDASERVSTRGAPSSWHWTTQQRILTYMLNLSGEQTIFVQCLTLLEVNRFFACRVRSCHTRDLVLKSFSKAYSVVYT